MDLLNLLYYGGESIAENIISSAIDNASQHILNLEISNLIISPIDDHVTYGQQ